MKEIQSTNTLYSLGLGVLDLPEELKKEAMWAVSTMQILDPKTGRIDKAPRNPKTGQRISVTSSEGWTDFNTAINAGYKAIGIRLTKDDPWVVMDLDASKASDPKKKQKQNEAIKFFSKAFNYSYQEKSYSGKGIHIFLKGPAGVGLKRDNIEIYSRDRYIICTGNVIHKSIIALGGERLEKYKKLMSPSDNIEAIQWIDSKDQVESDEAIKRKMFSASNGEKVKNLYNTLPSGSDNWSHLDAQLAQHIVFYTDNHDQAIRIFRGSKLYRGNGEKHGYERVDKYESDYLLKRTFMKALGHESARREQERKDQEEMLEKLKRSNKNKAVKNKTITTVSLDNRSRLPEIQNPEGLVGSIAEYICGQAHKPFWEAGIAGALTLVSGMAGRHYNIDGQGLGLYTVLLAQTGRGKEAAISGVSALMDKVSEGLPTIHMFQGPGSIASGQGLLKNLADSSNSENIPSKICMLSEFGHTLKVITSEKASSADIRTRQALLDLFSKSRWGGVINESAHADKSNSIEKIRSPNISILGDTTPELYFKSVTSDTIAEGLMPRFMVIEYDGPRGETNYNKILTPPADLVTRVQTLATTVVSHRNANECTNIQIDSDALVMLREFEDFCDKKINSESGMVEMWNRIYQKVMRIAGTVAVGNNFYEPRVDLKAAKWAIELGKRDIQSIEKRFTAGDLGGTDMQMEYVVREQIYKFFDGENDSARKKVSGILLEFNLMPFSYINQTAGRKSLFTNSSRGRDISLIRTLNHMVFLGDIVEYNLSELKRKNKGDERFRVLKNNQKVYGIGDNYQQNWKLQLEDMEK